MHDIRRYMMLCEAEPVEISVAQMVYLYHGTPEEETAESLRRGVDPTKFEGGYFGWGFYVTEDAALARSNYAGRDGFVFQYELLKKDGILDLRLSDDFITWRGSGFANKISDRQTPRRAIAHGIDAVYDRSMGGMCIYNPKIIRLVNIEGPAK